MNNVFGFISGSILLLFMLPGCQKPDVYQSLDHITLSITNNPDTGLIQIAKEKGFFTKQGLDVSVVSHDYGKQSLAAVLNTEVNFGVSAETPLIHAALQGQEFFILAKISSSNNLEGIIARNDTGITSIADLSGKKIGTLFGTSADFFLDSFLLIHGIPSSTITTIDLKPSEITDVLRDQAVDAVAIWEPEIYHIQKTLGINTIVFFGENKVQTFKFYLVGNKEFIVNHPDITLRLMRALYHAQTYLEEHPEESLSLIAEKTKTSTEFLKSVYDPVTTLKIVLDQTLLLALEDQSRWAIRNNLTTAIKVPNYLDYIYTDALDTLHPEANTILR